MAGAQRGRKLVAGAGVVAALLALAGAAAWWQRGPIRAHLAVRALQQAGDADRDACVEQAAAVGEDAVNPLLACWARDEPGLCRAAGAALAGVAAAWPVGDGRRAALAADVAGRYATLPPAGQHAALSLAGSLADDAGPSAEALRPVVAAALAHPVAETRALAAVLAGRPHLSAPAAILPLLRDPAAEVRLAALLAVGPTRRSAGDEELLPLLHDADAAVRHTCETALRSRGLSERDVELARLLTHADPAERLKLLVDLSRGEGVDLSVWLTRLSRDASPAMRCGAARVAVQRGVDLSARLAEMAQADPSASVRAVAAHWLKRRDEYRADDAVTRAGYEVRE